MTNDTVDDHDQAEDPPNEEGAAPAASGEPLEPSLLEEPPRGPVRQPLARRLGRYVAALGLLLVVTGGVAGVRMLGLL